MCNYYGCSIPADLTKQYSSYPNLCYFHTVRIIFNRFILLLKEHCYTETNPGRYEFKGKSRDNIHANFEFNFVSSKLEEEFPDFLNFISPETFIEQFNKVLGVENFDIKVDTIDFCFPIQISNEKQQLLLQFSYINGTQLPQWNNFLELEFDKRFTKFYDINFIRDIFESNKTLEQHILNNKFLSKFSYIYSDVNIDNSAGMQISLKIQNVYVSKNLTVHSIDCIQSVDISNCKLLGEVLEIAAPKLTSYHNEINSKKVSLKVPYRQLKLVNSIGTPLFTPDTQIDFYDGFYEYDDNNIQEDIAIYDSSYPYGMLGSNNAPKLIIPGSSLSQNIRRGIIQNANLHKARFLPAVTMGGKHDISGENITKLNFINCQFDKNHKLYEEINFKNYSKEQKPAILKRLESSYRYLRKHYDEKGDYIEGNDFHYNYMEAKRKNTENAWDRFLLGLYEGLNGYNTKPEKTFWILVLLVLTSSLVIFCLGEFDIKDSAIYTSKDNHHYAFSLLYAFSNLVPLINSDLFVPKNWVSVLVKLVENISSPILVTFFVMALRNRFRRSKSEDEFK